MAYKKAKTIKSVEEVKVNLEGVPSNMRPAFEQLVKKIEELEKQIEILKTN